MIQNFKINKKRVERLGLTCSLTDDNGKVHHFQDGHEYVEIGDIKWATCNIGAEKETDNGLYFQWGDIQGYTSEQVRRGEKYTSWEDYKYGSNGRPTKYNSIDGKTMLEPLDDAARFHMGDSWRMPTEEDFLILLASATNEWVFNYKGSGVNGRLFTNKADTSKSLFFPSCGYCYNGNVDYVRSYGYYWSNSLPSSRVVYGRNLYFDGGNCFVGSSSWVYGFSVRGVFN